MKQDPKDRKKSCFLPTPIPLFLDDEQEHDIQYSVEGKEKQNPNEDSQLQRKNNLKINEKKEDIQCDDEENGGSTEDTIASKLKSGELNMEQYKKIKEMKEKVEKEIAETIKNKSEQGKSQFVKKLVSQDKTRFCHDGFDLDLTYITKNIVAMGFPSSKIEGYYRNKMEDVKRFFATRHNEHYKVFNLCDDKEYPPDTFYRQARYPFKDHEAPPLNLIRPFCEDAKKFLSENNYSIYRFLFWTGRFGG